MGHFLGAKFVSNLPYSWPLINNYRANLMTFCKFLFVYLSGGPEAGVEIRIEAEV